MLVHKPASRSERILVVDDEPPILEIIHTILTSEGYQVDTVKDALEALASLATQRYDLVLSDVMLPEMGGLELLQKISLLYPQTITVMLTGYANIKDAVAAIKLGAFDYIAKPVYPEVLILAIERALKFKALREAAAELEWTLRGAEALGLQILELSPEIEEFRILENLRQEAGQINAPGQLAERFLTCAQNLSLATRGSIFLFDKGATHLRCMASTEHRDLTWDKKVRQGSEGVMGYVTQHGRPVLVMDVAMEPRFYQPKVSQRYESNSFMVVPILAGKLWGVINLTDRQDGKPFSPRELLLIWLLARILGEALEKREREERDRSIHQDLLNTKTELEEVRSYIDCLSASVSMGLAVLDDQLQIISANPAFASFAGRTPEDITGQEVLAILKLTSAGEEKRLRQCLEEVLAGESSINCGQINLAAPNQSHCFAEVRLVAMHSATGSAQILVIFEDVTEVAKMQQRVAFYEHLAIMGKLTACVVHELNNPLDGVKRYVSLALMKKEQGHEVERYLQEAQKGLQKMSQAINSMLNITNPNRILKAKDNLTNQLQEAIKIMLFQATDKGVDIALAVSPIFEEVLYGSDLYTVFVNLIKNALQAMPEGGQLHITGRDQTDELCIEFKDTGTGIPAENLAGIFKPFFTTKAQGQGLGLGLPICHKIVEKYRGQIEVASILGQGSTFTVRLPWPSGPGKGSPHEMNMEDQLEG